MGNRYYTITELQSLKFYELPNVIYNAILRDLERVICASKTMPSKLLNIFNKAPICELDQYVNIYKHIVVI